MSNAIVIIGGFSTSPRHYTRMADRLREISTLPVSVVPIMAGDWPGVIGQRGWTALLGKLDATLTAAVATGASEIIVVAHSLGGIVTRLYLAPGLPLKFTASCADRIKIVVTLGSPHQRGLVSRLNSWNHLDRCLVEHAPSIPIISVVGRVDYPRRPRSLAAYAARLRYRIHGAQRGELGDGIIPVKSAIFDPAHALILDGVKHDSVFGRPWYGDPEIVDRWWAAVGE
ncbi:MAG: alpha/beta fold hydrolase [candidate division Zixibacteria bacterium]|nr:alpha/beta fold hydrolase [candidate division Zixibacteria bacterium]